MTADTTVFERLQQLLQQHQAPCSVRRHDPVYTSEQAAEVRGASLSSGAKALVCKADDQFVHIVIPADLRLDSKRVRRGRQLRSLRFASREEVLELTGLAPGSIPPFGSLFGLPTWCDERLLEEREINFNAGDHSISLCMSPDDFVRVEQPQLGRFGQERS